MQPEKISLNLAPEHLRQLVADVGLSQMQIARQLQLHTREFRAYLAKPESKSYKPMPYVVYYALSVWAAYCRYERKTANNSLNK